jgi:hypothetical protein
MCMLPCQSTFSKTAQARVPVLLGGRPRGYPDFSGRPRTVIEVHVVSARAAAAPEMSSRKLRMRLRRCWRVRTETAWNSAMRSNRRPSARGVPAAFRLVRFRDSFSWRLQNFSRRLRQTAKSKFRAGRSRKINEWDGPARPPRTGENKISHRTFGKEHECFHSNFESKTSVKPA